MNASTPDPLEHVPLPRGRRDRAPRRAAAAAPLLLAAVPVLLFVLRRGRSQASAPEPAVSSVDAAVASPTAPAAALRAVASAVAAPANEPSEAASEGAAAAAELDAGYGLDVTGGRAQPGFEWRWRGQALLRRRPAALAPGDPARVLAAATVVGKRLAAWTPDAQGAGGPVFFLELADGSRERVAGAKLERRLAELAQARTSALARLGGFSREGLGRLTPAEAAYRARALREQAERQARDAADSPAGAVRVTLQSVQGLTAFIGSGAGADARFQKDCADEQAQIERSGPIESGHYREDGTFVGSRLLECDPSKPMGQRHVYETITPGRDGKLEVTSFITSPLVFDLSGDGPSTSEGTVLFDLDGKGRADATQWINDLASGTGLLVFDLGRGKAGASGLQLFGNKTDLDGDGKPDGYKNGFEALNALAAKAVREKVLPPEALSAGRLDSKALAALGRAYGLAMRVGGFHGRVVSLEQAGVRDIALSSARVERVAGFDGRGNDVSLQPGATFVRADGSTGGYADVWLAWAGSGRKLAPSPFLAKR